MQRLPSHPEADSAEADYHSYHLLLLDNVLLSLIADSSGKVKQATIGIVDGDLEDAADQLTEEVMHADGAATGTFYRSSGIDMRPGVKILLDALDAALRAERLEEALEAYMPSTLTLN